MNVIIYLKVITAKLYTGADAVTLPSGT